MSTATSTKPQKGKRDTKAVAQSAAKDERYHVVHLESVPLDALFESWERIDWRAVNRDIQAGNAVFIPAAREERHWIGCALRELGRQNVFVTMCHVRFDDVKTQGLWIMPRSSVRGVLTDAPYEFVASDD